MLMPSLTKAHSLSILSKSLLLHVLLPWINRVEASVHSTNMSLSPAETQDQLGLIRKEIRSLQEQLPFPEVEENVKAFVDNAMLVLEEQREPVIALDWLR